MITKTLPVLVLGAMVTMTGSSLAHRWGSGSDDLTPPLVSYAEDVRSMRGDFGTAAPVLRGVYNQLNLWPAGQTLMVCFYDGDSELKALFVATAQKWLQGTSLKADFGLAPNFRTCGSNVSDIRVTFLQKGYWSYIGTDSLHAEVVKKGASLNIETNGLPFRSLNLPWIAEAITHEFGHALGLLHEHQSPASRCGDEFDWGKITNFAKDKWGWTAEEVRTNFAPYVDAPRLRTTPYDKNSVMHYALADWMFKRGKKSRCYVSEPRRMSKTDRSTVVNAYPPTLALQSKELEKRAATISGVMNQLRLNTRQLAVVGAGLGAKLRHYKRKIHLEFALTKESMVRGADVGSMNPCEGEVAKLAQAPTVSCGVAPDGTGLVLEVDP
ncbi:M12 family metallopeptidase [Bradyrhizobium pachyrhizi]|uniref:M12 family metallopeptidase n=1 Tax=Bradyrhizobium pachyrhizi TaxID=280333 RepID=UPI0024B26E67|nr:M12 family metallopeptidase [Bradyrhizobium pachyrhizi]WFU55715.1 M12 family metallopeptidase [Bradyrhizobium pachyrhizi]